MIQRKYFFKMNLIYIVLIIAASLVFCEGRSECRDTYPVNACQAFAVTGQCNGVRTECLKSCGVCEQPVASIFTAPSQFGQWTQWIRYDPCSVTCGSGIRKKYRDCTSGPGYCIGSPSLTESCTLPICRALAKWGQWVISRSCSVSCGNGIRIKVRLCFGPGTCDGRSSQVLPCKLKNCEIAGQWGPWGPFTTCSKTCGVGQLKRYRTCKLSPCSIEGKEQVKKCKLKNCEPKRGSWTAWTKFGPCSKTCDRGTKRRIRRCIGGECSGKAFQVRRCIQKKCKVLLGTWGPWSQFTACTKSCGRGLRTWKRRCSGRKCVGSNTKREPCATAPCPGGWSPCTKTCGVGTQFKYNSKSCTDRANSKCFRTFRECNAKSCPAKTCPLNYKHRYQSRHSCCRVSDGNKRIINGVVADIGKWEWMVLLESPLYPVCGGSLLTSNWVLTAAHCVEKTVIEKVRVYAGIRKYSERSKIVPNTVSQMYLHPNYHDLKYDIALLKLATPVALRLPTIGIISLPQGERTPIDSTCFTAGWGLTNLKRSEPSESLLQVDLHILDGSVCHKAYVKDTKLKDYILTTDNLICAGSLSKSNDACFGDSGGPLVCQRCSSCDWYIAGLTSFGPGDDCGKPGHPGMYTRVEKFEPWIHKYIPSLKSPLKRRCSYEYGP